MFVLGTKKVRISLLLPDDASATLLFELNFGFLFKFCRNIISWFILAFDLLNIEKKMIFCLLLFPSSLMVALLEYSRDCGWPRGP